MLKQSNSDSCIHRRRVVDRRPSNLCGRRGEQVDIFGCELFGECVLNRYRKGPQSEATCSICRHLVRQQRSDDQAPQPD